MKFSKREYIKEVSLKPVLNKRNGQINFSIKKNYLPTGIKDRLPVLKSIKLRCDNFQFN